MFQRLGTAVAAATFVLAVTPGLATAGTAQPADPPATAESAAGNAPTSRAPAPADPGTIPAGHRITVPGCHGSPLTGEDLQGATPARLAALGLPPKPATAAGIAQWQAVLLHARNRHCTVTRVPADEPPPSAAGRNAPPPTAPRVAPAAASANAPTICLRSQRPTQTNGIWSGAVAYSPTTGACHITFDTVFGAWKATADQQSTQACQYTACARRLSEWAGLGGWSTGAPLVQAGFTQQTLSLPTVPTGINPPYQVWQSLTPWAEVWTPSGDGAFKDWMDFSIQPGDTVIAMVWSNASDDTDHFLVEDGTTGDYDTDIGHGFRSDGSTAEWIVERPGGGSWPLLDFGHVHFDMAYAAAGPATWWLSQLMRFPVTMTNGSGSPLAHASLPTPIGYPVTDSQIDDYWSAVS